MIRSNIATAPPPSAAATGCCTPDEFMGGLRVLLHLPQTPKPQSKSLPALLWHVAHVY